MLSILDIVEDTTVDGPGFRTSVYAAGCGHACVGCHNPESWNIEHGKQLTVAEVMAVIRANPWANVTFTGGDPFYQPQGFAQLACAIKAESEKTIWCYTGFRYEALLHNSPHLALLQQIDVLVDGLFVQELVTEQLPFRGSSNQRLIDVPRSLAAGRVVCVDA